MKKMKMGVNDNSVNVSLVNLANDFSGFSKFLLMFISAEMRNEMVLRYKAETIMKVGGITYDKAKEQNIKINPIDPKFAIPLINTMSLEHEPDMYEKWANLFIATGLNNDPIYLQYADILCKINKDYAEFLRNIFNGKGQDGLTETFYYRYFGDDISKSFAEVMLSSRNKNTRNIKSFPYPFYLVGSKKSTIGNKRIIISDITEKERKMLLALKNLDLIIYDMIIPERAAMLKKMTIKYGVLLTQYGFEFIKCLEGKPKKRRTK